MFVAEVEGAEVALIVLALEQRGLVPDQQAPALRAHGQAGNAGAGGRGEVIPTGGLAVQLGELLAHLLRVLVTCSTEGSVLHLRYSHLLHIHTQTLRHTHKHTK